MKTYIELNRDDKERAKHLKEALDRFEEKKLNPEPDPWWTAQDQDTDFTNQEPKQETK